MSKLRMFLPKVFFNIMGKKLKTESSLRALQFVSRVDDGELIEEISI